MNVQTTDQLAKIQGFIKLPDETLAALEPIKDQPGIQDAIKSASDIYLIDRYNLRMAASFETPGRMLINRLNAIPTVWTAGVGDWKRPTYSQLLDFVWQSGLAKRLDNFLELDDDQLSVIESFCKILMALQEVNSNFAAKDKRFEVLARIATDHHSFTNGLVQTIEERQIRNAVDLDRLIEIGES